MQLVKVKVVCLQTLEGLAQLFGSTLPISLARLACQKHLIAQAFQGRTEPLFGITVSRGDIKVSHAVVVSPLHHRFGVLLRQVHHDDATHRNGRNFHARLAQLPTRD
jgi:hypothetical protein